MEGMAQRRQAGEARMARVSDSILTKGCWLVASS